MEGPLDFDCWGCDCSGLQSEICLGRNGDDAPRKTEPQDLFEVVHTVDLRSVSLSRSLTVPTDPRWKLGGRLSIPTENNVMVKRTLVKRRGLGGLPFSTRNFSEAWVTLAANWKHNPCHHRYGWATKCIQFNESLLTLPGWASWNLRMIAGQRVLKEKRVSLVLVDAFYRATCNRKPTHKHGCTTQGDTGAVVVEAKHGNIRDQCPSMNRSL